jgi:hypothetical protein
MRLSSQKQTNRTPQTMTTMNEKKEFPIPSYDQQNAFLLRLYFGMDMDNLRRAIRRAYLDLCRTIHGIKKYPDIKSKAEDSIRTALDNLRKSGGNFDQNSFDNWHKDTCNSLIDIYKNNGYEHFCIGQAQKWINMALKYVYIFGEERERYANFYKFCHVPIDNIILEAEEFSGITPNINEAWSRINDYKSYLNFQIAIREKFQGCEPLAVEFWVWQDKNRS